MKSLSFFLTFIIVVYTARAQSQPDTVSYSNPHPHATITVKQPAGKKVKNVILMIGDGMGLVQVSAAWVANQGRLNLDNFPVTGFSRTTAANKLITASGAAGTAMATGKKAKYHSVGVDTLGNPLPSLTTLAHKKGLGTGIMVTCNLSDATPAAFCANNMDRNEEEAIAADYINCNVDYIFGAGRTQFNNRKDGRHLMNEMKAKGYNVANTWAETHNIQKGKVFALLEDGQLPLAQERGDLFQKAVMKGLQMLGKNPKGFFAMVEGSRIDDCGHWNDLPKLMEEVLDFDKTIGAVLQWAEKDGQTLVVVLADHETGGLTLLDGNIQKATVKGHFSTGGHSGILVPVYAYGPQAEKFTGIYENTEVFDKIAKILELPQEGVRIK